MKVLRRFRVSFRGEGGFSLAEVLIAGLILAVSVIPMVGMFDGSYKIAQAAYDINMAEECLRFYAESVRNLPFYQPHDNDMHPLGTPFDVDDHYWGTRSPMNDNSWSDAPEVDMKPFFYNDPYPEMSVAIKMSYIDDALVEGISLEAAANSTQLDGEWLPEALYGADRPMTPGGKSLNLILYEVKVTTDQGQAFTDTQLYASPTDVLANVYLDKVINVSADTSKKGTHENYAGECDSAPHDKNNITVRAYGEGFIAADIAADRVDVKLVRVDDADVQLVFDASGFGEDADGKYIEGTIDLQDSESDLQPWSWVDCRAPGYWHAWLVVEHVISVRNNAFVVEYPPPVYHDPGSDFYDSSGQFDADAKRGLESETDELIRLVDVGYTTEFDPVQYGSVGAVIQLVHTVTGTDGLPIDVINGTDFSIVSGGNFGYQPVLEVSAHFDFTGHTGGDYKVRVINCIDRSTADIDVPGNTYFEVEYDPMVSKTYYYLEGPPRVDDAYVYEETPVTTLVRHFGYEGRQYPYTLEITGYNFDNLISVSDVKLGFGGDIVSEPPVGENEIEPLTVDVIDDSTLRATFDFTSADVNGYYGQYWLYVRNSNGFGEVENPAFDLREPAPIVYAYSVESYGLWQNYYNVDVQIIGECFDVEVVNTFDVMIKEDAQPINDWLATEAMDDSVSSDFGRQIDCKVNLVDCDSGLWELYVKNKTTDVTDNGYTDFKNGAVYTSEIDVTVGTPVLLTGDVPVNGEPWSLSIASRYKSFSGTVWSDWSDWAVSTEGGGVVAWAWENDPENTTDIHKTEGEMYFVELRGMGFNKDAAMRIQAVNDDSGEGPGMNETWTNLTVNMERDGGGVGIERFVWIEMIDTEAKHTGPDQGGYAEIRMRNDGNNQWCDWYIDRFRLRSE